MLPAFESKKEGRKAKRLKIAEIRVDIKPVVQGFEIL